MIFLLSNNYFDSLPCLNEMGAAWLTQSDYTTVFVPNFDFTNSKFLEDAIDARKIGVVLDDSKMCKHQVIELKNTILDMLGLSINEALWQYILDEFIDDIKLPKKFLF